ncbi:MAG: hypothetical protein WA885_12975 [Phormidesmis sp.]
MNIEDELPLLELFTRLRQAGLPLGMTEYRLLLQALQSGFGLPDRAALARLCRTLWVKSEEDQVLFNYHFEEVMAADTAALTETPAINSALLPTKTSNRRKGKLTAMWQRTSSSVRIALGAALTLSAGVALWIAAPLWMAESADKQCPMFVSSPKTLVGRGDDYEYEIEVQPCEGNSSNHIEISVLREHPSLSLKDKTNGSALLSGQLPTENVRYSRTLLLDAQGEQLSDFDGLSNISDLQFSKSGQFITTRMFDETARMWNFQGKSIGNFNQLQNISEIQYSENGRRLITHLSDDTKRLWNAKDEQLSNFEGRGDIETVRFMGDGLIVTSRPDKEALLWDAQGKLITALGELDGIYSDVLFQSESQVLIVRLLDGRIRAWDAQGEPLDRFNDLENIEDIWFVSDRTQQLITRSSDQAVWLWDTQGNRLTNLVKAGDDDTQVEPLRDQQMIAVVSPDKSIFSFNKTVSLWDMQGNNIGEFEGISSLEDIQVSEDEQRIITRSANRIVQLWSAKGQEIKNLGKAGNQYDDVQFTRDENQILIRSQSGTARLWSTEGKLLSNFQDTSNISDIRPIDNGQKFIVQSSDKVVRLVDSQGNQTVMLGKVSSPRDINFSDDGQTIVVHFPNNTAQIWSYQGRKLADINNVGEVQLDEAGQRLAFFSREGTAQLWDLQGNKISDFDGDSNISYVEFLRDHQLVATYASNAINSSNNFPTVSIQIWDYQGNKIPYFGNSHSFVSSIADLNNEGGRLSEYSLHIGFIDENSQRLVIASLDSEIVLQATNTATKQKNYQHFTLQSFSDPTMLSGKVSEWIFKFSLFYLAAIVLGLPALYIMARQVAQRRTKPTKFPTLPKPTKKSPAKTPAAISALNQALDDEVLVAQAIYRNPHKASERSPNALTETQEYFPITSRQMKQSWRTLRRLVRAGPAVELDVDATVKQTCRTGMLLGPALRPRRVNRNELLLLIDQEGSMVPFHALSARLAATALQGGRLASTGIHYFHNCPDEYLYRDPYHQDAETIDAIISRLHSEYTGVLIFSDAGAARGTLNRDRIAITADFLARLRQKLQYIAWLNPMPRDRWTGTASEIAKLVPMFELSRRGLDQSIDVLRGKSSSHRG